jgi:hypothetical protein
VDENKTPGTLVEAIRYFADEDRALAFMVTYRWPDGVVRCPVCDRDDVRYLENQRRWECRTRHPRRQFSIKVGTIFEDSPIGLDKWLPAVWMLANDKNGISSYELARSLGVTQKTAWFMLSRIRLAMHDGDPAEFSGQVEADETYIGGLARNMHKSKRERVIKSRGSVGKEAVLGLLERHGPDGSRVRLKHVPDTRKGTLQSEVWANVARDAELLTDAHKGYDGLSAFYAHEVIDHAEAYARGHVHTNGLENFWSLLKRAIKGTYISVEPFHLFRYLDEQAFRYNGRKHTDAERFGRVLSSVEGKRLTFQQLTGKSALDAARGAAVAPA